MKAKSYLGLSVLTLVVCLGVSCGKEEPATEPLLSETPPAAAPGTAQPAPGQPAQPAGPSPDAVVFDRTLVYVKGRIAQNDFQGAREAIAPLENQSLTPAQKSQLDALKRQIPQ